MDFLLVGESKIKIVLSRDEAESYGLDKASPDVSGPVARRSFWRILDMAKAEVGFDPAGDKVLIQLYPIKSGGCEIFVTKLGILSDSSARMVSKSDRVAMLSKKQSFYSFDSLDDLINASRAVRSIFGILPASDVYAEGDRYYLAIEEYGRGGEPTEFPCILEFASSVNADMSDFISEHASKVTEGNAIERFSLL